MKIQGEIKKFLMPTKGKIILFAAFFVLLCILFILGITRSPGQQCMIMLGGANCRAINEIGIGMPVFYIPAHFIGDAITSLFLPTMLIVNIIIYYIISCTIIFVYNKIKK